MTEKEELIAAYKSYMRNRIFDTAIQCVEAVYKEDMVDGRFLVKDFRDAMIYEMQTSGDVRCLDLSRRSYMFTAPYSFDDFMIAMEWDRNPNSRFWLPRRKILEEKFGVCTAIEKFMAEERGHKLTLSTPPGCGKALANDTPVLTRKGWKKHGDLSVGDEVIGADGKFKKVLRVFPKVMLDCKITFGNETEIICHEQHEWYVWDRGRNTRRWRIAETAEFFNGKEYSVSKPPVIVGEEKELPVAPYTLGAWLGDGENKNPRICNAEYDYAIIDRIVQDGYPLKNTFAISGSSGTYFYSFEKLRKGLRKIGLCSEAERIPKTIPDEYYTASIEQRLLLLAGLLDTDGTYQSKTNRYCFTTAEDSLKDAVVRLISTFGWRVTLYRCKNSVGHIIHGRTVKSSNGAWAIWFNAPIEIPCVLERKRNHISDTRYTRYPIKTVERINPVEGNCIEVEDGMYLVSDTLIPTHNSTLIKFLMCYIMGKYPQSKNMYVSYADSMVKMMMDAVIDMTSGDEYNFQEIFPIGKPEKSAEYNTIGYRRKGDAQTFNMCSIGGSITGRTRADTFMITDDLVKNAEEARSPERLETLYANYTDTISTRQIGKNVKEIMLGTIWSIYDPISREKIRYEGEPGYHFYAFPVCDEEGHSNFHYDCEDCYTDEKIAQIREKLDPVTFSCLYLQRGIQKEGMPFTQDQLTWYDGVLPDGEPDNVYAFCDVAFGGGDSLSMPIAYVYGHEVYIHDVVFSRKDKSVTVPIVAARLQKDAVRKVRFEANVGGQSYADEVSAKLKEIGYSCNVTSKRAPNTISKLSKIEQFQQDIREIRFRRDKDRGREYDLFINELQTFSFTQKNLHDDAADSLAGLCDMNNNGMARVDIVRRRF